MDAKRSITDFLADVFFERAELPRDYMSRKDIRKIQVRMQLILSGQADAAIIPEPMLTLAEKSGGKVLLDDRGLNMPLSAVALRGDLPDATVEAFRSALSDAVSWINANPEEGVALMEWRGLIYPEAREGYELPVFDPAFLPYGLPDKDLYDRNVAYLQSIEVLQGLENPEGLEVPAYEEVVWSPKSKK